MGGSPQIGHLNSMTLYLPLDLETTGLDPILDRVLEVAWCVTSTTFDKIDATQSFVVSPSIAAHQRLAENDYVFNMHATSGLLDAMEAIDNDLAEGLMVSDIEDRILASVAEWPNEEIILLGQSPQGVDRPFIRAYMPRLDARLSYRHFDVRTLMDFFDSLNAPHGVENTGEHRAANDVEWSLGVCQAYYRAMRTNFTYLAATSLMSEPDEIVVEPEDPEDFEGLSQEPSVGQTWSDSDGVEWTIMARVERGATTFDAFRLQSSLGRRKTLTRTALVESHERIV